MPRSGVEFLIRHRCGHWSRFRMPGHLQATTVLARIHVALCPACKGREASHARAPTADPPEAS